MMAYAARILPAPRPTRPRAPVFALMRTPAQADLLIRRVAETRDKAAFQDLFAHFAPRVKAYLMRLGANAQAADDLSQEALLAVWRKAHLFDPAKAAAATWIFTIARNLRIDALRRERIGGLDGSDPSLLPPAEPDAGDVICTQQREAALRQAMQTLSAEQAQIVLLSFFSDKPHSEIAAELDIPLGTVKSRLRLAMARLRASLGEAP